MTGSDTSNSPQHSENPPRAHAWCCLLLLLCGRVVCGVVLSACSLLAVMCELRKENRIFSRGKSCLSKSYVRTWGQGMWKPQPRGCCGNPWIFLIRAQGQKSSKGLPRATHCTDHAQTSGNVTPTVESCPPHLTFRITVRARRGAPEKYIYITIIRIHTGLPFGEWGVFPAG